MQPPLVGTSCMQARTSRANQAAYIRVRNSVEMQGIRITYQ
ncbi:hypothetical protein BIFGAL_03200 [Bifidobacterium gallicum DSM 20093 = LMG 11596]|uniref:Uncharacterized protein n=1 Tax=Bifidobacterium gallicum DSM 20093 = LMG 11596 TaxID=561180 RepID=D1NTN4_9BIFI|nr:hypothetical protein BIFGAL_03200 [Bifidobacterium gallicum DSM 20093 = LMG 11596]